MPYPADVSREQLRLGSGQRQAVVQGIEKSVSGDPAPFLDEDAVHGGELHGGASEAQQGNARPNAQRLAQARPIGSADGNVVGGCLQGVSSQSLAGGEWRSEKPSGSGPDAQ